MLGVALSCLLGACPVFVTSKGREISSSYIDKPGILKLIFHSISGVHVCIVQQLLPHAQMIEVRVPKAACMGRPLHLGTDSISGLPVSYQVWSGNIEMRLGS